VGREFLADGNEVDSDSGWRGLLAVGALGGRWKGAGVPWSRREVPSGTYLRSTLRRRYSSRP
jgi:hypothetical protein